MNIIQDILLPVAQNGVGHKESWGTVFYLRTLVLHYITSSIPINFALLQISRLNNDCQLAMEPYLSLHLGKELKKWSKFVSNRVG